MKLVVGLGNPGVEYEYTRHNIGYLILDRYLGKVIWKEKFQGYLYSCEINNELVVFLKPTTHMNLSGISIKKVIDYYDISINDVLIIQDDIDLEIGTYKIKKNSSSGGHNGIKSIIHELNSDEFARLKIGVGKSKVVPIDKYVLGKIPKEDLDRIMNNYESFAEIINAFINGGFEKALSIKGKKEILWI